MGGFRAAGLAAAAMTALGVAGLAAPAYADSTVTVEGTAFPDPAHANLSFVGCSDLYQRTNEPLAPTIGLGPGRTPNGSRSLGWDLAGGNAVGAVFPVSSVLATATAGLEVNADGRATGVAYAGYQEPADAGTSLLWIGRVELTTPGGAWQAVEATSRAYTWGKYDMATGRPVSDEPGVPTTVADFATAHGGDGPGFYTIGFGCDGTPFSMDSLQVGSPGAVTTYDLEGLRTSVTITGDHPSSDGDVTITGRLRTDTDDPIPFATMILERREPSSGVWRQVQVAEVHNGVARAVVRPEERTLYRWRFVERPLAEGSTSPTLVLGIVPTLPTDPPSPTATPPTDPPTDVPSSTAPTTPDQPTTTPPTPSGPASPSAPQSASQSATQSTPSGASSTPAGSPPASPSDSASQSASPAEPSSTP